MKLIAAAVLTPTALAFAPSSTFVRKSVSLSIGSMDNVDLGGNSWKPDSEKMGSTDVGDYFPEGYDPNEVEFTQGMGGSSIRGSGTGSPELPGMENLGADAVLIGGIEEATDIPAGMEFIPSSVPDGSFDMQVSANSDSGSQIIIDVAPVCMTFEDYYAAFSPGSHPSLSVSPQTGRMDRRGGETTPLTITCEPKGQAGMLTGDLVINLPEDNSKIHYKINVNSF